jgi:hypothetical protein
MEKLKKELKEWWNIKWLWGPMLGGFLILGGVLYYKSHYCKEIPYKTTCKECAEWKEYDNGYTGKYKRTWEECEKWEYYECTEVYDSCGCNKVK